MDQVNSREYSWAYVAADVCLARGPCELVWAYVVPTAATTDSALYDGTDTQGEKITDLKVADVAGGDFAPPVPVYCDKGLYVDVGTSITGIFVLWKML